MWNVVEVSPKFVGKDVEVWCKAIAHELAVGEIIWAFVSASDTRPATIATVITNSRIAGFYQVSERPNDSRQKCPVIESAASSSPRSATRRT